MWTESNLSAFVHHFNNSVILLGSSHCQFYCLSGGLEQSGAATEKHRYDSQMIEVYQVVSDKLSGCFRSSANPDVFARLLFQLFHEATCIHIPESDAICIIRIWVVSQDIGYCATVRPLPG